MSGFESIIGQEQPIRILSAYLVKGCIPHAFLFTGIEGIGKRTTATAFAMALNCQERNGSAPDRDGSCRTAAKTAGTVTGPCGQCRSCRKIMSGNHPDMIHISPSGSQIKIAQIRSLIEDLAMKPYEAKFRTVLISEAHCMNPEAGNALLKVLEEPPPRTILLLTAPQVSDLLPTVISRCQHIRFNPLSEKSLAGMLVQKQRIDPDQAAVFASMANGSYRRAAAMVDSDWLARRRWLLEAGGLECPASRSSYPIHRQLAFAEGLLQNREDILASLEIMKSWYRDLVIFPWAPDKVINKDLNARIERASREISIETLLAGIETIQSAQRAVQSNANLKLTLDTMMLRLADT